MACTPPTLKIFVTPTVFAANNIAGCNWPSLSGGEHKIISLQPAMLAGMPSINKVENNGAVPPGMYKPTFSMPTLLRQHCTPGMVSIISTMPTCFL